MEKLFVSRIVGVLCLCFSCSLSFGQSNYYVFKKQGKPALNTTKLLERGSLFSESDTLFMAAKDYVLLVNELGELFEINKPNKYAFSAVIDYQRKLEADSFTKKYFTYVWKQFTNQLKRKQEAGVVYREERNIQLVSPIDSLRLFSPEVRFKWQNNTDSKEVFFFLRNLNTNHLTKIGLTGNTVLLNLDNLVLKPGETYEWSVATEAFPNLNKLKFNRLKLLTKVDYDKFKQEINTLIKAFTLLGFSEAEIKLAICLDYKFCDY